MGGSGLTIRMNTPGAVPSKVGGATCLKLGASNDSCHDATSAARLIGVGGKGLLGVEVLVALDGKPRSDAHPSDLSDELPAAFIRVLKKRLGYHGAPQSC
jgi:hypothetical protein